MLRMMVKVRVVLTTPGGQEGLDDLRSVWGARGSGRGGGVRSRLGSPVTLEGGVDLLDGEGAGGGGAQQLLGRR